MFRLSVQRDVSNSVGNRELGAKVCEIERLAGCLLRIEEWIVDLGARVGLENAEESQK